MKFIDSIRHYLNPEVQSTFDDLYNNYYKGLKSYCDGTGGSYGIYTVHEKIRLSTSMSYSDMKRIYDARDEIRRLHSIILRNEERKKTIERNAERYTFYSQWETDQASYASKIRELSPSVYGCYCYDIDFPCITQMGEERKGKYRVWQLFKDSFYDGDSSVLSDDMKYLKERASKNSEFLNRTRYYYDYVYDEVFNLLKSFKTEYGNISVVWGNSESSEVELLNNYHFKYLRELFAKEGISCYDMANLPSASDRHIVVVELLTSNDNLKRTCLQIIETLNSIRPLIAYVSIRKGYAESEVVELVEKKQREKKEKEEEERRERERIRQEEERKRQEAERKQKELSQLRYCVSGSTWYIPNRSTVRCFSLYYYYPTTCPWEASEDEWSIRRIIWNFKANPHNPAYFSTVIADHRRAVRCIMPDLKKLFNHYFGSFSSMLTLVCIPSSTKSVTELRYSDFSKELCDVTNMDNGYDSVHIVREGEAKHTGGKVKAQYSVDSDYFKDRYVVLFDDVITSGGSMERFKGLLENAGAYVICGISIGRTKHERQYSNPIDSL